MKKKRMRRMTRYYFSAKPNQGGVGKGRGGQDDSGGDRDGEAGEVNVVGEG